MVARDALREAGYRLDRVDSERGVLTTQARAAGGSPWTSTPATDVLHEQARTVRVEFAQGSAQVECFVVRTHSPSVQLAPRAVGLSMPSYAPALADRGLAFRFGAPLTRDGAEASRLAGIIQRAVDRARDEH